MLLYGKSKSSKGTLAGKQILVSGKISTVKQH